MLILERPWTRQPQGAVGVNRSNAAGQAISTLIPFGTVNRDIVSGVSISALGSGGSIGVDSGGKYLAGSGSAAVASIPLNLSRFSTISVSFWMYWNAFANDDDLAFEFTANTNSNSGGFHFNPNSSSPASGTATVFLNDGGANAAVGRYFSRPTAAAWHHYAMVLSSVGSSSAGAHVPSVLVDGVSQSLTTFGSDLSLTGEFANSTLYLLSRAGTALYAAGRLRNFVIRGNYRISQAEAINEWLYPWSLFAPSRLYIPTSTAAATPTLSGLSLTPGTTTAGLSWTAT